MEGLLQRLLWPTQIQRLIEQYREQNRVNPKAVEHYMRVTNWGAIGVGLISAITLTNMLILLPFTVLFGGLLLRHVMQQQFARYAFVYAYGSHTELPVTLMEDTPKAGNHTLLVHYQLPNDEIATFYYTGKHLSASQLPQKDQLAPVFYYPQGKYKVAPDVASFRQLYELSR